MAMDVKNSERLLSSILDSARAEADAILAQGKERAGAIQAEAQAEAARIAQEVARRCGAKALVTGECLGQVASQTMDAMLVTGAVVDLPILRPVVGMDKEEIVQIARKIGTFETSILPYEDCCTVFTPRHPRLRPLPGEVEFAEEKLDIQALIQAAVDGIERVQV